MTLTPDQKNIYENIIKDIDEAIYDDIFVEHSFLSITGPSGTGKTFLSHSIVDTLVNDKNLKVGVLAPTHKALKVIKNNININHVNITYATLHSFLGLKPKIDFKTGKQSFVKDTGATASALSKINVDLMIVDESSFVGTELFQHIKKEVLVHNRVKVVLFIGDKLQLLPVEDTQNSTNIKAKSAIFDYRDDSNGSIINHYALKDVIRNGNLEVLDFYTIARKMVEVEDTKKNLLNWLREESQKEHSKIHFFTDKSEFVKKFIAQNKIGKEDDAILTFTNQKVNDYNNKIRNYFLKQILEPNEEIPEVHETDIFIVQSGDDKFINSETLSIKRFNQKDINFMGKTFIGYQVETTDGRYFNICSQESKADYLHSCELLKLNAIKQKSGMAWKSYYEFLGLFLDVKYHYSMTIHKSQGSTLENVYVDCTGIDYVDDDTLLRLFYVATTRAKNEVNILL